MNTDKKYMTAPGRKKSAISCERAFNVTKLYDILRPRAPRYQTITKTFLTLIASFVLARLFPRRSAAGLVTAYAKRRPSRSHASGE